jgi:outer membrane biogenesis lipoprotein LolB
MSRCDGWPARRSAPVPAPGPSRRRTCPRAAPPLRALATAGLLAITGCASTPPAAPVPALPERVVEGPREWVGRFSVRLVSGDPAGKQEAADGRFELTSVPAAGGRRLDLELISPFGQTMATAHRQPDGAAMLALADGRTLRAGSLDALLERALGWPLPIEQLPDWLDDRFENVTARDAQGAVTAATDSGWRIERDARRWTLQRPQGAGGQLRVVLLLDR